MARNASSTAPAAAPSAPAAAPSAPAPAPAPSAPAPAPAADAGAARARARGAAAAAFKGLEQRSTLIAVHGAMGAAAEVPALPSGESERMDRAAAALVKAARSCFSVKGDAVIPADEFASVLVELLIRAAHEADRARGDRLTLKASSRTVDTAIKAATRGL